MSIRLAHLGIAVPAHSEALRFWRDLLGLPLEHTEHVGPDGVTVAMLRLGASATGATGNSAAGPAAGPAAGAGEAAGAPGPGTAELRDGSIELLQPDVGDNPVRRFLDKRGPGIHHLALEVDDIDALVERLLAAGVRMIDPRPRPGAHGTRVAFVHPQGTGGVLLELVQKA